MLLLDVVRPVWPRLHQALFTRINRARMLRGYFADAPIDLGALPAYRREHFPDAGPAPWLDADAEPRIDAKVGAGVITPQQADWCRTFARDGYLILEGFYDREYLDEVWEAYEAAIRSGTIAVPPEKIAPDDPFPGRFLNPHRWVPAVDRFLRNPTLEAVLDLLLGRKTVPFQTISAHKGSQQPEHSDAIHMTTFPLGYMIAAWTAFEDIHADAGPLVYCPGSHRLPYALSRDVGMDLQDFTRDGYEMYRQRYEPFVQDRIRREGLEVGRFLAQKGDVFVWHHNLIHGGSTRADVRRSRKSIVSHHFTRGAICYHDLTGHLADIDGLLPMPVGDGPKVIDEAAHSER